MPRTLYLPLVLRETHTPKYKKVDVVLVIDASSSMTGVKIVAAQGAARAFIEALSLPDDRVALVSFNARAELLHPIVGDAAALDRAIDGIVTARGTRIDRGLRVALDELGRLPEAEDRVPAIVLLTDGRQYEEPEAAQDLARQVHADGIALHAIGLGGDVDQAYLVRMAGTSGRYYFAPDATKLRAIYRNIAVQIPCDPEQFWGRRC